MNKENRAKVQAEKNKNDSNDMRDRLKQYKESKGTERISIKDNKPYIKLSSVKSTTSIGPVKKATAIGMANKANRSLFTDSKKEILVDKIAEASKKTCVASGLLSSSTVTTSLVNNDIRRRILYRRAVLEPSFLPPVPFGLDHLTNTILPDSTCQHRNASAELNNLLEPLVRDLESNMKSLLAFHDQVFKQCTPIVKGFKHFVNLSHSQSSKPFLSLDGKDLMATNNSFDDIGAHLSRTLELTNHLLEFQDLKPLTGMLLNNLTELYDSIDSKNNAMLINSIP